MNKSQLIRKSTELLRENNIRKGVAIPKHVFHISDNEGNSKDFIVKKRDKECIYTIEDVTNILDACLAVVQGALRVNDPVYIHGFGTLGLNYRKPRRMKDVQTGEEIEIPGRYLPKFSFGNSLRMCAKVYELSAQDKLAVYKPSCCDDEEDDCDLEEDGGQEWLEN